ncbi:MAG: Coenzyme F420 hydrogenase/dehydrogenase, beta subunit C-terminal domain [Deltaproteobacteria bacterium]|nr:Coenzyme F420 hydrogenase/dehydrogenase, beta subunit C-terminal domain [Deltaproteobacteria bacterium]
MNVFGPAELVEDVQKDGLCIGCGACVNLCPYFLNHRGKTVQIFPCSLTQGRCYAACPKAEVDLDEISRHHLQRPYEGRPMGPYAEALAAKAGANMTAGAFQGGGAVSALLVHALKQGLIDAAVLTGKNEKGPVPSIASSPEEILACASSKFTAAPTLAALNRAVAEKRTNLGVVGTPCHMTAVAKWRTNPLAREDFEDTVSLTIGLFCNWGLDQKSLSAFLDERLDISRIKGMDIPPPPANALVVDLGDESIEIPLDEIRPFIPETCGLCPDMTAEWADLSVGMFEGRPGWNTLLVRSQKGKDLVAGAVAAGLLTTEPMPETNLGHLENAAKNKKRRAFMKMNERGLLNPSDDNTRAMLRVPQEVVDAIVED